MLYDKAKSVPNIAHDTILRFYQHSIVLIAFDMVYFRTYYIYNIYVMFRLTLFGMCNSYKKSLEIRWSHESLHMLGEVMDGYKNH